MIKPNFGNFIGKLFINLLTKIIIKYNSGNKMNIPLLNRIKKRAHRDIALIEDVLIKVIYEIDNTAEIHGGTVIWRCFGGRRFSKDIDVYLRSNGELDELQAKVSSAAERYGASVTRFKDTGNLVFAKFLIGGISSEIDLNYKRYYKEPITKNYENADGTFYDILIPSPEALLIEKIEAYNDRISITDLYDIRILADFVEMQEVRHQLRSFLSSMKAVGKEEERRLEDLIYEGPIPSYDSLVDHIKGRIQ